MENALIVNSIKIRAIQLIVSLMHAGQDLIEQGKVLVYSSPISSNKFFQNPLPPHSVSAPVGSRASVNLIEDAQGQEELVHLLSSASDEVNVMSPLVLPIYMKPCPLRSLLHTRTPLSTTQKNLSTSRSTNESVVDTLMTTSTQSYDHSYPTSERIRELIRPLLSCI